MSSTDDNTPARNDLDMLREHLFETIRAVKAGAIDLDRARVVNELGKTLVDSGRLQVDYLRVTGGDESGFLEHAKPLPTGVSSVTVHRIGR